MRSVDTACTINIRYSREKVKELIPLTEILNRNYNKKENEKSKKGILASL
jgi:hypothetical protein